MPKLKCKFLFGKEEVEISFVFNTKAFKATSSEAKIKIRPEHSLLSVCAFPSLKNQQRLAEYFEYLIIIIPCMQ